MIDSIESIWQKYNQEIGRYLLKLSADSDIASELKSTVFEKLILKFDNIKDKSNIKSWLYTVSKNEYFDNFKIQKKFSNQSLENQPIEEKSNSPVRELSSCALYMISSLPENFRRPLYMSDIKGMKQKTISEKLGLSYSGLKSRVQRARMMLKENLLDCCKVETNNKGQIIDYHMGMQSSEDYCKKCFT
jgi:RNA polymerase sigma-70 factor (ECF subfamily)